jgi:glucose dehydrogenase
MVAVLCLEAPIAIAEPVDDARLRAAAGDARNWLTFGHDYTNQRFSPQATVSPASIGHLVPRWIHQTGITGTFQTQPLVADGMMVITTPGNHVTALDAATGVEIWRYRHKKRKAKTRGGPSNRGAALGYGKVYQATNDGRLIALDRATGTLVWDSLLATPGPGEVDDLAARGPGAQQAFRDSVGAFPAKMPPLVADGLVIAGVISAGYSRYQDFSEVLGFETPPEPENRIGRRGYLVAFDARTGAEKWRWHTVKADGWEGEYVAATPDGVALNRDLEAEKAAASAAQDAWRAGGGSAWMTPAYDPDRGLLYLGTGNPSPADADLARPGDNLYTSSLVALDVATGRVRWHYQIVPHDIWGYDTGSPPILFDVPGDQDPVAAVGIASKNGWFYVLDRSTGELLFKSEAFVPQNNMFPRPKPGPNGEDGSVLVIPGSFGGASWSPGAYDPSSGFVFVPGIHKPTLLVAKTVRDPIRSVDITYNVIETTDEPSWGTLTAIDTRAGGRIAWQTRTDQPLVGGLLATAGGIVFAGEGDGHFSAFDSNTGKRVWRFQCGAGVNAPPVAYQVDGVSYIAVAAGGHRIYGYPAGDAIIGFALGGP